LCPPELVAYDNDICGASVRVGVIEQPAHRWTHSQCAERIGSRGGTLDMQRLRFAQIRGLELPEPTESFERAYALAKIDEVANRDVWLGEAGSDVPVPKQHQSIGLFVWKGPQ
jgi:hypothetical protein